MTRIVVAGLALCWLAVGAAAWRGRRRDVVRHGPARWHRAVATLQGWSAGHDGPPVATTWCRPLVVPAPTAPVPRPRDGESGTPRGALVDAGVAAGERRP